MDQRYFNGSEGLRVWGLGLACPPCGGAVSRSACLGFGVWGLGFGGVGDIGGYPPPLA